MRPKSPELFGKLAKHCPAVLAPHQLAAPAELRVVGLEQGPRRR